ncbi:MAG: efflux RND transporter periplasmic adaptor subunit [Chloroflexi bacterium]|nr:efflux RND transporter periplasmic adaptor subunit [Chloroflexota bacterium]
MDKRTVSFFIVAGILIVSAAGYLGFSTAEKPEPTPAPQTVSVNRCDVQLTVTAPGNLVNVGMENVNMPVTGKLTQVHVRAGEAVRAGQILADLDSVAKSEAQLKMIEAQEEFNAAQKKRTSLDYPRATDEYIKQQKNTVKQLRQKLSFLQDSFQTAVGPEAKAQILDAIAATQKELQEEETKLKWYMSKPTEADFAAADSDLALAQAKLDAARAVLESLEIRAPFDGIVLETTAETGITINAETTLFKIGDPKALEVKATVTEEDFPLVTVEQEVEIYFDARPDVVATGKVSRIIPNRLEGDRPLYAVFITLDEVPEGLADGMTSDSAITIEERENALCLPRAVVRASGGDVAVVEVWNGITMEERRVFLGLRGDANVEILSGLQEGDQVVVQ